MKRRNEGNEKKKETEKRKKRKKKETKEEKGKKKKGKRKRKETPEHGQIRIEDSAIHHQPIDWHPMDWLVDGVSHQCMWSTASRNMHIRSYGFARVNRIE